MSGYRDNLRWKSIQSHERLEKFLTDNPEWYVVDTRNKERRFYVRSDSDSIGLSVDGRSVNVLLSTGKIKVRYV